MTNPMLTKLNEGKVSLGMITFGNDPNWIEIMAYTGIDHVWIDMMLTPTDWNDARHLVNAARAAGITPIIRLPANPWDTRNDIVGINALRAFAIGADGVKLSYSTVDEVRQIMSAGKDWHQKVHIIPFTRNDFKDREKEIIEDRVIIPGPESQEGWDNSEEVMAIEGMKFFFCGLSDTSRDIGHPFDYEHPAVWKLLDKAVKSAEKYGLIVGANTGYGSRDITSVAKRIKRLCDHGIREIIIQSPEFLLQTALTELREAIKNEIPGQVF
jgi:2-keto-3-deoxy-L-rhamnonate aldolase RhmA